MIVTAAVLVIADLIVKNPHYAVCMALEEGSWEWWLRGCFIYDTSPSGAATLVVGVVMAAYVGIQLWARRSA